MIKFAKAIAANTDLASAQAFIFPTQNINLAILVSAFGEDVFTKVRNIIGEFGGRFFELDGSAVEKLNQSFEELQKKFLGFDSFQLTLSAWQENILYIRTSGGHQGYLMRDGVLSPLLVEADSTTQLISGHIQEGDRMLFITNSLEGYLKAFSKEEGSALKQLIKVDTDTFEEEVTSALPQVERLEPVAAILIDYHSDLKQKPEIVSLEGEQVETKLGTHLPQIKLPHLSLKPKLLVGGLILMVLFISVILFIFFTRAESLPPQSEAPTDSQNQNPLSNLNPLPKPELFMDLSLVKEGFKTNNLSISQSNALLLDNEAKTLVLVDLKDKKNQILAGKEKLGDASLASLNGDFAFVFSDKGVVRVDIKSLTTQIVTKPDEKWGEIRDIVGFASNVYLLDTTGNQIWKYVPTESGYSDKFTYLTEDTKADFTQASSMQIDASIWVLKADTIEKFTRGAKDHYAMPEVGQIKSFVVSERGDHVYILSDDKLTVTDKTGKKVKEYTDDSLKFTEDLLIDEDDKILYLLQSNNLYTVKLP